MQVKESSLVSGEFGSMRASCGYCNQVKADVAMTEIYTGKNCHHVSYHVGGHVY